MDNLIENYIKHCPLLKDLMCINNEEKVDINDVNDDEFDKKIHKFVKEQKFYKGKKLGKINVKIIYKRGDF